MFKSVLCITICLSCVYCENFDPKERKYCDKYCLTPSKKKVVHTSCNCAAGEGREEIEMNKYPEFRRIVLEEHNKLRNKIASGLDTRNGASSAANMMALSYDLELEYMTRCYLRSRFNGYHDTCRLLSNGRNAGQNIAGQNLKNYSMKLVKKFINDWYEEIKYLQPDVIDSFRLLEENEKTDEDSEIAHFTALVWAESNKVGCARLYTKDPRKLKYMYDESFRQTLLCNYGITILEGSIAEVNAITRPVYQRGKPCSQCPENFKCNTKYPALCGEIESVPTDPPYDFDAKKVPKKGGKRRGDNTVQNSKKCVKIAKQDPRKVPKRKGKRRDENTVQNSKKSVKIAPLLVITASYLLVNIL
nr:PREDICTED: CRISP/Allergen/PR-1 [Tribolium castaneum]|eukprot:XP_008192491.2 PREDICTED: CRISP/Allergen/PR-1 [Tribolium castaneum]